MQKKILFERIYFIAFICGIALVSLLCLGCRQPKSRKTQSVSQANICNQHAQKLQFPILDRIDKFVIGEYITNYYDCSSIYWSPEDGRFFGKSNIGNINFYGVLTIFSIDWKDPTMLFNGIRIGTSMTLFDSRFNNEYSSDPEWPYWRYYYSNDKQIINSINFYGNIMKGIDISRNMSLEENRKLLEKEIASIFTK